MEREEKKMSVGRRLRRRKRWIGEGSGEKDMKEEKEEMKGGDEEIGQG